MIALVDCYSPMYSLGLSLPKYGDEYRVSVEEKHESKSKALSSMSCSLSPHDKPERNHE